MSMILIAAALMTWSVPTTDTTIGRQDWVPVVATANRTEVPAIILYRAMTAPEVAPRNADEPRPCIRRDDIVPGKTGMVCRTRAQWAALGIDITATDG